MGLMTHEVTMDLPYTREDCFLAATKAMESLGHKIEDANETMGIIRAKVAMSLMSTTWGDILTVTVADNGGRCKLTVNSTAKAPTLLASRQQIKNVQAFSDALADELESCDPITPTTASAAGAADEIRKYKGLLDEGIITQAEFDAKKKQLLGL